MNADDQQALVHLGRIRQGHNEVIRVLADASNPTSSPVAAALPGAALRQFLHDLVAAAQAVHAIIEAQPDIVDGEVVPPPRALPR